MDELCMLTSFEKYLGSILFRQAGFDQREDIYVLVLIVWLYSNNIIEGCEHIAIFFEFSCKFFV